MTLKLYPHSNLASAYIREIWLQKRIMDLSPEGVHYGLLATLSQKSRLSCLCSWVVNSPCSVKVLGGSPHQPVFQVISVETVLTPSKRKAFESKCFYLFNFLSFNFVSYRIAQYSSNLSLLEICHSSSILWIWTDGFSITVNLFSSSTTGAVHQVPDSIFIPAKFKVIILGNSRDRC